MDVVLRRCLGGFLPIFGLAACLSLGGCANAPTKADSQAGYVVRDSQGQVTKLAGKPQRILSLTLGTDEILMALVSPDRVAGLTQYAFDPGISNIAGQAGQVKGQIRDVNAEAVLAIKPDLVVAWDFVGPEAVRTMREIGIPLFVCKTPASIADIRQAVLDIAEAVGEGAKGQAIA
ncbi:MAG TPA: ABC transporter substrate-binding protein, partial [Negativicutes bacterium]|nr:ABC transporter substrate-binding protein [Negativicutes bacterium]